MAKPTISKIKTFDSRYDYVVSMNYSGNLPYSNKITIYNATTLSTVYTNTVETHLLRHTIPAGTLVNGTKYAIDCQMFDSNNVASAISDKVYFWVYETPTFEFVGLSNEDTIENSMITLQINYSQSNWEDLFSYQFYLYDENKQILSQSDILYDTDNVEYTFKGLENHVVYYVRAYGTTQNGMSVDTDYVQIFTDFKNPSSYARIYTECDENGIINGYTNISMIEPSANPDDYEFNNGYINLIDKTLVYDQDFLINDDFTLTIRIKHFKSDCDILKASNGTFGFTLSSFSYNDATVFKLVAPNGLSDYILYSDPFYFGYIDIICIHIRRINNIYQLKVLYEGTLSELTTMWLGTNRPTSDLTNYDVWIDLEQDTVKVEKDNVVVYYQDSAPTDAIVNNVWIGGTIS